MQFQWAVPCNSLSDPAFTIYIMNYEPIFDLSIGDEQQRRR